MEQLPDIAVALTEAAKQIYAPTDVQGTLDTIVQSAQRSVPGINHVGISVTHRDGRIETKAATDPLVQELDHIQYELGEGPCLDSIWDEPVVLVEGMQHEQRWPLYVPQAIRHGVRSQLGLRLYVEEDTLGGLNLYSTESDTVDTEARQLAALFATHAALALGRAQREASLNTALDSRKIIGQAIGIVMERYALDEGRAFQYLSRVSQTTNVKLRDVAGELVRQRNEQNAPRGEGG